MKMYLVAIAMIGSLAACRKDEIKNPPTPTGTEYTDFNDREVKRGGSASGDLNKDGQNDLFLYVMPVGDALFNRDYIRYHILGSIYNFFPMNANEEAPILQKGDSISATSFDGYNWYNATELLLAQKVIELNPPIYWQGSWKDASHRYLPMRLQKGESLYYGWIELSFDTTGERIIMHKAAINREANKAIKAGY